MRAFQNSVLQIFWFCLGATVVVWLLRGLKILAFLPSSIIWILLILTFATGIVSSLQRTR